MINPMRSTQTRIMGLASGMDTDGIVQATLRMHQFRIDNQLRNRRLIEWRQETHNTIRDEIRNLRSTFLSNLSPRSMLNRQVFNSTSATVTGNANNAVSIRTTTNSPIGTFNINAVQQLASGAHLNTTTGVSGALGNGFAGNTRLGEMAFGTTTANPGGNAIEWTQDGGTIRVGSENIKIERSRTDVGNVNAFTFTDANNNAANVTQNGNDFTITSGATTRTITWDEVNNRFIEDIPNTFSNTLTIPDGSGGTRDVTITASQADNGAWSFHSSEGTAVIDGNGDLILRIGPIGSQQITNLGNWDENTMTLSGGQGGNVTLNQQTRTAAQLHGEAVLTFNTTATNDPAGDVRVTVSANDTLNDMVNRVNNSGAGVVMSYDRLSDRFTLQSRTGTSIDPAGTNINVNGNGSNFFSMISTGTNAATSVTGGQQGIAIINGEEVRSNTNTFDFRGVQITLNSTFNIDASGNPITSGPNMSAPISVTLQRDATNAINAIRGFIDSYNAIISRLEGLLNERKTGNEVSYRPLTDEEKAGMSDRQIEQWESIARKGIMRNDQSIQSLVFNLRRSFFEEIEGMGMSASQLGLTTGAHSDGTGGQIMIDEDRLRAALESDPDRVADIFTRIDSSSGTPRGVGLLHRIDNLMMNFVNTTQSSSIRNLEDSLKRTNEQISRMEQRMWAEEERLFRQFAAMETAMSRLQQQGDWFSSMLGTGTGR